MASNFRINEKGQVLTKLPTSGIEVKLRQPKGKDLKAIEQASNAVGASNAGTMMLLISLLAVEPVMSLEEVEELELSDIMRLGECLESFQSLRNMGSK